MRKIRLEKLLEFGSRADFAIIDVTEEPGKKRGTITIDYAPADIEELKKRGLDLKAMIDYYESRIYDLVKYYISGDWEDAGSLEGALEVVRRHLIV